MNALQRMLLSFGIIILAGIFIYLMILWFIKSRKNMQKQKMLTMNLVIKYNPFLEYLEYQILNKEEFDVLLIKLNNLNLIESKYSNNLIREYLRLIVKELSVYLPFGGKIAQTNNRDTFIIYYPKTNEDMYLVSERFKTLASKTFHRQGVTISKTNSVALVSSNDYSQKNLSNTLVNSVRNLGEIIFYDHDLTNNIEDYINVLEKLKTIEYDLHSFSIGKINDNSYKELYNEIVVEELRVKDFLIKFSTLDQPWININVIEYLLSELYANNIFSNISVPVLMNTLEKEMFVEVLEKIVMSNHFLLEQIILSLKITNVNKEEQVIKNLLNLSNMGIKSSLELDNLNPEVYSFIQKYNIGRVEINDKLMNDSSIAELLYFAKVNHIEVLYKTNQSHTDLESLNISHITKNKVELKTTNNTKKRGKK